MNTYSVIRSIVYAFTSSGKRRWPMVLLAVVAVVIFAGEKVFAQQIEPAPFTVTEGAGTFKSPFDVGTGSGATMCTYDRRELRIGNYGTWEWQVTTCSGGSFDPNGDLSDIPCSGSELTTNYYANLGAEAYQYRCQSVSVSADYCEIGEPSPSGAFCVTQEESCGDGLTDVVDGCVCASDSEPEAVTGSCDRDPIQFCVSTDSYISASADCTVGPTDCSTVAYSEASVAECGVENFIFCEETSVDEYGIPGGDCFLNGEPIDGAPYDNGDNNLEYCSGNYYTDPSTRETTCGTYNHTYDNGTEVQTSTDASGTTTTTTATETANADGSTTISTTTTYTYVDGSSSTSTSNLNTGTGNVVTSGSTGSSYGPTTAGNGEDTSCVDNIYVLHAGVLVCEALVPDGQGETASAGTASGGQTCEVAPSCSGDEIQCQILYQQWKTRCESGLGEDVSTIGLLEEAGLNYSEEDLLNVEKDLGDVVFDATGFLPSSSECPSGIAFDVLGNTYTFSFEGFCLVAEMLGYLVLALSYFIAYKNLVGSF